MHVGQLVTQHPPRRCFGNEPPAVHEARFGKGAGVAGILPPSSAAPVCASLVWVAFAESGLLAPACEDIRATVLSSLSSPPAWGCFCFLFSKGEGKEDVLVGRDTTPCASPVACEPDDVDRTLTRPAVLNGLTRSLSLLTTSQHGATLRLVILDSGRRAQDTAQVLQSCDRVGNLAYWRTTDASTQESSNNATSCTSWLSPAVHPRRRARRSATLS